MIPGQRAHWFSSGIADLRHRAPLRQIDVLDRPVEAAGAAQPGHVPAPGDDLRFGPREHPAPVERAAVRAPARLAVIEDLKAAQHPGALLAAAAELPAPADAIAALDRHRLPAARHRGAGDRSRPAPMDLVDALVRQPQRHELADAVVGEVPADRAAALGQQLDDAQIGQRVDLQSAESARDHHAVEPGVAQLLDQRRRQALLALDLLAIAAQHRLQRGRCLHHRLRVDICRQARRFGHRVHRPHSRRSGRRAWAYQAGEPGSM